MSNITDFDAIILSNAIKEKKVSTTEVMSAYLDRIEKINPKINAIISIRYRDDLMPVSYTHLTLPTILLV